MNQVIGVSHVFISLHVFWASCVARYDKRLDDACIEIDMVGRVRYFLGGAKFLSPTGLLRRHGPDVD